MDAKHAIITDTHVTPASVHDSQPYLDRLDRQRERFEFKVEAVGLDAGYFTPAVCQGLEERGIAGVMGYRTPNHKPGMFYKRQFKYDAYRNEYVCPQGQALPYSTTNRLGYREYKSNAQICGRCPVRSQCTNSAIAVKVVTRHVWERAKERVDARRLTEWGQRIYARRKQTVERSFADACMGTVMPVCVGYARWPSSACWPRRHRTSRRLRCCWRGSGKRGQRVPIGASCACCCVW
ncbi:transposase [Burkholderia pseudomallei]|nr:transposase [Burkholderia pseudomallei]CAJ4274622.1 transposase [Burkholderia pseudomallei]CAJ5429522.1 transposase [Burkholderia pseudomallei]CAJ5667813.1 transposase [Burkholderia pseudomallei]CAJ5921575.1 transposase [Burkholderia pseudomallei]